MASLPKALAFRLEQTGHAASDRAQRLAQQVAQAHEQTKAIVSAIMNRAYVALAVDLTVAAGAYTQLLSTTITTVLAKGNIDITVSTSGQETTAVGTKWFLVLVDGVAVKGAHTTSPAAGYAFAVAMTVRVPVTAGPHSVVVQWKTDAGNARINAKSIPEEHAHLLVQEAL